MTKPDTAPMGLEEIARLEAIARAATPGPWHVDHKGPGGGNVQSPKGPVADARWFGNSHREARADYANAAHIAAFDPPTVLRLLAAATRGAGLSALVLAQEWLSKAADQFAFYADEHAKKGTPEADAKAATNHQWALKLARADHACRAALSQPTPALSPDAGVERPIDRAHVANEGWRQSGGRLPPVAAKPAPQTEGAELSPEYIEKLREHAEWAVCEAESKGAGFVTQLRLAPFEVRALILSAPAADAGTRELGQQVEDVREFLIDRGRAYDWSETDERGLRETVGRVMDAALTRAGGEKGGAS